MMLTVSPRFFDGDQAPTALLRDVEAVQLGANWHNRSAWLNGVTVDDWTVAREANGLRLAGPALATARQANNVLIVGEPEPLHSDDPLIRSAPSLIVGAQRTGSTALQYALCHATRYRAPRPMQSRVDDAVLEGHLLRQLFWSFAGDPLLSPIAGQTDRLASIPAGVLFRSGKAEQLTRALGRCASDLYVGLSGTSYWIDKCPGWEAMVVPPLLSSLFPRGRTLFLTRPPVSNVRSMAKLANLFDCDGVTTSQLLTLAQLCASWVLIHHLWRVYLEPILPAGQSLVVPWRQLRETPTSACESLGKFLQLSRREEGDLVEKLLEAPDYGANPQKFDWAPTVESAVATLCLAEAYPWGYATDRSTTSADPIMDKLAPMFEQSLQSMLLAFNVPSQAAREVANALTPRQRSANQWEARFSSQKPLRAGPLLLAMLQQNQGAR